jgi:Response regulator of citrate/malate metabolism
VEEQFLTVDEVAESLRISRWSVGRYINAGLLEAVKLPGPDGRPSRNGAVRIPLRSYEQFIQRNTVTAREER